eukprot:m51a1_g10375 putative protein (198) ;mRNA; r:104639-105232
MATVNCLTESMSARPVEYRVGVHCGPLLVGNLGSHSRVNYTVCGNTANVASRMEQMGKTYGASPLVSGAVQERVSAEFVCVWLDVVQLRGKSRYTRVYHLACKRAQASQGQLAAEEAFGRLHETIAAGRTDEALLELDVMGRDEALRDYWRAAEVVSSSVVSGILGPHTYAEAKGAENVSRQVSSWGRVSYNNGSSS